MGRRRVHRPDAGSEPVLMQNNLPPLCDAERRFFVCSAPTGPGLQISGLRRFRCIVRPFRRRTAIRLFRRSAAGDGHGAVGVKAVAVRRIGADRAAGDIHGEIKAGQVGIGCVQAVVRGTNADVARSDVQRRGLQPLIAIRDRDRRPVRALRADLERVVAVDRGYPAAELIDAIGSSGHSFIMRCPTEFLRSMKLPEQDNTFEHKFAKLKHSLKLRVLKIQLSNGDIEYLATNIFDPPITVDDFKWAYHKRWGIETKYNDVKNKLEIENFTGYSPDAILQDFYATMFLADLAGVLEYDLREEIEAAHIRPENRYTYKLNVAMTISELKRTVVEMLSTSSRLKRERLFAHMVVRLSKAVVPVRPDRSSDRLKKHKSLKFPSNVKRC